MEGKEMKQRVRILSILLVLVGSSVLIALPALAQEPIYLRAVEPSEGRPGEELQLTVWGGGFGDAQQVGLVITDLEVWNVWIESDEAIMADVFIPEDAPPGPRPVEVMVVFGPDGEFVAGLEAGFFPPPHRSDDCSAADDASGNFVAGLEMKAASQRVWVE
jgi:hypothetical protein